MAVEDDDQPLSTRATRPDVGATRKAAAATVDRYLGTTVGERYRIIKKLGQGGMGAVYSAEHVLIEKQVAIKILTTQRSRELMTRFAQEAKAASKIGHENIINITDFGETEDGAAFLAMEQLDGHDLGHVIRTSGALPIARITGIFLQVCRALAAAHNKGIVHRDLKPDNVFLIERGGRPDFVKLLDFGLARVTAVEAGSRLTKSGTILGTPEYMAPEQVRGDAIDGRADVYAAGCMLFEMLTGDIPFVGGNYMVVLQKHMTMAPMPPSSVKPAAGITPELDALVLKAMAKSPDDRFASMDELALALRLATGVASERAPEPRPKGRPLPAAWLACAAGLALLLGGVGWWRAGRPTPVAPATVTPPTVVTPPRVVTPPTQPPTVVTSHIKIVSEPGEAEVMNGNERLGQTPLGLELPSDTAPFVVTLSRHGFKEATLKVAPDQSHEYVLALVPLAKKPSTPTAPQKKPPADKPADKPAPKQLSPELKDVFNE